MPVISEGYQNLLKLRYAKKGWGASGYSHAGRVDAFAMEIDAHSILDYGCGRGTLKKTLIGEFSDKRGEKLPGFGWHPDLINEYDPGITGKDQLPTWAHDLVVSTDVLEHIEPKCLDSVLKMMRRLAGKGLFLNIATTLAKEILPDGRNAHLIVEGESFWLPRLLACDIPVTRYEVWRKGIFVWAVL